MKKAFLISVSISLITMEQTTPELTWLSKVAYLLRKNSSWGWHAALSMESFGGKLSMAQAPLRYPRLNRRLELRFSSG